MTTQQYSDEQVRRALLKAAGAGKRFPAGHGLYWGKDSQGRWTTDKHHVARFP